MPTEPAPAPTSHSSCPGAGSRRASAAARRSRFVSWPSCSNASSGNPVAQPASNGPVNCSATMFSRGASPENCSAVVSTIVSWSLPRSPSTTKRLGPYPRAASKAARAAGVFSSDDSTSTRRAGASSRRTACTSRPTTLTTAVDSADQPSRDRASAADDTCGMTVTRSAPNVSTSVVPMPLSMGSPEASATTRRPANCCNTSGRAGRSGDGPWLSGLTVRERGGAPVDAARPERRPPDRITARAAAVSPSQPSAPTPTTTKCRSGVGTSAMLA